VDAIDGIPNETRQPFEDGSTDFERILPGPDRMYPDTDSPPQRITRERVERLGDALPERPWLREERYAAAGVPRDVIHFLIRRGGARLVDMVVAECGADLRRACFFFGERIKGLRRAGLAVDDVEDSAWRDFFALCGVRPVLWEAWRDLVEWMVLHPNGDIFVDAATAGFGIEPKDWTETVSATAASAVEEGFEDEEGQQFRCLMGVLMNELRGRVPAARVAANLHASLNAGAPANVE
jgi:Glu-tRNA(Gln) amidotransferase subunit E-like FAD-binding protein